jgi:hypothetical protein
MRTSARQKQSDRPEPRGGQGAQTLQVALLDHRPHERHALARGEQRPQARPRVVLGGDRGTCAGQRTESALRRQRRTVRNMQMAEQGEAHYLEILSLGDGPTAFVLQLQGEIAQQPHEGRELVAEILRSHRYRACSASRDAHTTSPQQGTPRTGRTCTQSNVFGDASHKLLLH